MQTETPRPMFDTDEMVINMGPQHPSTHGVLRLILKLDGERVVACDPVIGYLHRGVEKLCESRDYTQIVLITDRMDYVAAATNNLGYVETIEKLMSIEVPRRARYIRTILSELQRVASHLLWLGTHAADLGAADGAALRPARAGAGARPVRGVLRRAAHLQLDAHRRPAGGPAAGLGQEGAGVLRSAGAEAARVRDAAHAQPHLRRAHEGHRHHLGRRRDRDRPVRPAAARVGRLPRRPQGRAVRRLRRDGVRRAARREGRHLRPLPRAPRGVPAVAADHPPGRGRGCPRGRSWARCRG